MHLATPITVVYFDQRTNKLFNRMEPNLQNNFKWSKGKKKTGKNKNDAEE